MVSDSNLVHCSTHSHQIAFNRDYHFGVAYFGLLLGECKFVWVPRLAKTIREELSTMAKRADAT